MTDLLAERYTGETTLLLARDTRWHDNVVHASRTQVMPDGLAAEIAEALRSWGSELAAAPVASDESPFPRDEVEAIDYLIEVLGISQKQALAAVRVPKRTYFGWRSGREPRGKAKAQVWEMVRVVAGLQAAHPSLRAWIHSTPRAMRALTAGDASGLALTDLDLAAAGENVERPPVPPASDTRAFIGHGVRTLIVESEELEDSRGREHTSS